eukprot:6206097-Pleurochrysis_carterae.AAC.1
MRGIGSCLANLSQREMLPIRTMSQTAIMHPSLGRSVISMNVGSTYSLADCCPQLDLEIAAAASGLGILVATNLVSTFRGTDLEQQKKRHGSAFGVSDKAACLHCLQRAGGRQREQHVQRERVRSRREEPDRRAAKREQAAKRLRHARARATWASGACGGDALRARVEVARLFAPIAVAFKRARWLLALGKSAPYRVKASGDETR